MEDKIELLKKEYAYQLPQKIREIKLSVENIVKTLGENAAPSWQELGVLTHKLSGSSGTYGFAHLSAVARFTDDLIATKTLTKLPKKSAALFVVKWFQTLAEQAKIVEQDTTPHQNVDEVLHPLQRLLEDSKRSAA